MQRSARGEGWQDNKAWIATPRRPRAQFSFVLPIRDLDMLTLFDLSPYHYRTRLFPSHPISFHPIPSSPRPQTRCRLQGRVIRMETTMMTEPLLAHPPSGPPRPRPHPPHHFPYSPGVGAKLMSPSGVGWTCLQDGSNIENECLGEGEKQGEGD